MQKFLLKYNLKVKFKVEEVMTRKLGQRIKSKLNFEVILWIKWVKIEKNEKSSNRFLANFGQKSGYNELKNFTGSCHIYIYTFHLMFLSIMHA